MAVDLVVEWAAGLVHKFHPLPTVLPWVVESVQLVADSVVAMVADLVEVWVVVLVVASVADWAVVMAAVSVADSVVVMVAESAVDSGRTSHPLPTVCS